MAQYIDKETLVAEIERRVNAYQKNFEKADNKIAKLSTDGRIAGLKSLLNFIDTLEVKEVDLEKEIKESIIDEWCDEWSGDVGNWIRYRRGTTSMTIEDVKDIAKHFFELGIKGTERRKVMKCRIHQCHAAC